MSLVRTEVSTSRRRRTFIGAAIALGFSTVAIAEPAAAAPPEFSSFDEQGEFPIECDGFTIDVNATAHVTVHLLRFHWRRATSFSQAHSG